MGGILAILDLGEVKDRPKKRFGQRTQGETTNTKNVQPPESP
jgi:hypothetical protein